MIKRLALTVLVIFSIVILAGCNTVRGMGKDIESLGQSIKKASDKKEK